MFLLFINQLVLLFGCVVAAVGSANFMDFLNESQRGADTRDMSDMVEMIERLPNAPLIVSIVAIIILLFGIFDLLRYWKWANQKIAGDPVNGEVNPSELSEYEIMRRKRLHSTGSTVKTMYMGMLILSLIPAIIVIPVIIFGQPNIIALSIAIVVTSFTFVIFILWLIASMIITGAKVVNTNRKMRNVRPTKEQIIIPEMKRLFGEDSGYEPAGRFFANPYETAVVRRFDNFGTNDHIFGRYKGLQFEQMDVLLYDNPKYTEDYIPSSNAPARSLNTSDAENKQKRFKGRWVIFHQPKVSSGRFYIISKNAYDDELSRFKKLPGLSEVFLEDTEFNNRFVIYAEIPHDVFYVMTPPLIERMKRFADMGAKKPDYSLRLGFCQNRIHFLICGLIDAFDQMFGALNLDISVSEESARMSVRRDLNLITDVIDSLFGY